MPMSVFITRGLDALDDRSGQITRRRQRSLSHSRDCFPYFEMASVVSERHFCLYENSTCTFHFTTTLRKSGYRGGVKITVFENSKSAPSSFLAFHSDFDEIFEANCCNYPIEVELH